MRKDIRLHYNLRYSFTLRNKNKSILNRLCYMNKILTSNYQIAHHPNSIILPLGHLEHL